MMYTWFVYSDILEYGTYTQTYGYAEVIKKSLIAHGGTDASIEYDPWPVKVKK